MDNWLLILLISSILASTLAFVWVALRLGNVKKPTKSAKDMPIEAVNRDIEHIFNDEFRQELRNRGRLHLEKIISENAMFLQQDLRLTTSQLNEFMKAEITKKLQEEFANYQKSISDAKDLAVDAFNKTQTTLEEQRQAMTEQLKQDVEAEKKRQITQFEKNLADVVNHYIMAAIGNQIDLNDQLEYIIGELEANKQSIVQDLNDGT